MMRSMYSGISGLRAHQIHMDVIGNNIANVNTVGFKSSRVTFQEIYNQTLKSAAAPSQVGERGGTNPHQVGLGISVASIDVLHSRGSVQRTDKATDLAIDGDGFFIASDGTNNFYTRAGNLDIDRLGNLVSSGGLKILGWSTINTDPQTGRQYVDASGVPQPINLANLSMPAKATDMIRYEGNLDATVNIGDTIEYGINIFDSQGNEHKLNYVFTKHAPNIWKWKIVPIPEKGATAYSVNETMLADVTAGTSITVTGAKKPIVYDQDIQSIVVKSSAGDMVQYHYSVVNTQAEFDQRRSTLGSGQAVILANGENSVQVAFGDNLTMDDTICVYYNDHPISHISPLIDTQDGAALGKAPGYDIDGDGSLDILEGDAHGVVIFGDDGKLKESIINTDINIVMNRDISGAADIFLRRENLQFDPEKFTQSAGASTIKATGTGYTAGTLNGITIDSEGRIIGSYSNGQAREDAVLSIARFSNPGGLNKLGDNLYQYSTNSGEPIIGRAGIDGRGTINPGALEMSNVDLAREFTEMIVAQRGFQANSRIITVSDEMLQELVNLKR
jgi:flagellar hook protein FlgE